jgi:hypothetical protein
VLGLHNDGERGVWAMTTPTNSEVEFMLLLNDTERWQYARFRIVGSGFARADTVCLSCLRPILKGWEAWVTSYIDNDHVAYHPDCFSFRKEA